MVNTKRPLLYNYVFVHASEDEIFRLKRTLPLYNFLPRVSSGGRSYFPFPPASYSNELPVYVPDSGRLLKGDRVRITSGPFSNMEAEVVVQPGGGHKDVMVRILDCLWVPLFEVRAGEYELIELNTGGKHVYTHLDNDRLSEGLHGALGRYHASGVVVDEDARLAREVLRGYASLRGETDVIRCKLYSLLLPAYLLLGESDEFDRLHATMRSMLPVIKAGQSRALLLVTLYGCTDSSLYQRMAHELVGPWMEEASPKETCGVPSGIRLMNLLRERLTEIMDRERANRNSIHLYCTGPYWVAFERSAYQLHRAFPDSETTPLRLFAYPFPIVMVSVTDRSLRSYTRKHILRRDGSDYKLLTVPGFPLADYREWHAGEVEGLPRLSEN